ncbi:amidohydrolase [Sulfolobus sp. S-194]|uniref:amidohydrolase n=1 Tax=Sulfolobus sp. S-194 TaxID=2512240 RepID=UPI001436D921|nr:amidohydrolase [Sulfolobus sp. S-194]QIW24846.1 amidohydrolase [Sulfolobus sp. S-194]
MEIYNNTYTLKNCRFIVNYDSIIENSNIVIQDGIIKNIGKEVEGDEIDCSDFIVIPGLVNAHTHTPMSILRGYYDDAELSEWLNKMWEFEKNFDRKLMRLGSEISILEMLINGTTAFVDMYFNPLDVKELAEIYKIRAFAGFTFLDSLNDPYFIDKLQRNLTPTIYFKPIINVHSIYAVSENTLKLAKQLQEELNEWVHIHVSETRKEIYEIKKKYGVFPIEYLNKLGLLNRKIQLVHVGWISSWEIDLLKNVTVTYCPTSNMKLATGSAFPLYDMFNKGVNITLGTDGPASNNSLDLFIEMKYGVLLQRQMYWNTDVKAWHLFKIATLNGYKLLDLPGGYVKEGNIADLVLLDKNKIYPLFRDRLLSHLVYYVTGNLVKGIIVNGVLRLRKELENLLLEKITQIYELLNS